MSESQDHDGRLTRGKSGQSALTKQEELDGWEVVRIARVSLSGQTHFRVFWFAVLTIGVLALQSWVCERAASAWASAVFLVASGEWRWSSRRDMYLAGRRAVTGQDKKFASTARNREEEVRSGCQRSGRSRVDRGEGYLFTMSVEKTGTRPGKSRSTSDFPGRLLKHRQAHNGRWSKLDGRYPEAALETGQGWD